MARELMLYHFEGCGYCRRVRNYLDERGITVPMKNILQDRGAYEELKRVGGKSQVPCLVIDGKALYESRDIIRWFEEHYNDD